MVDGANGDIYKELIDEKFGNLRSAALADNETRYSELKQEIVQDFDALKTELEETKTAVHELSDQIKKLANNIFELRDGLPEAIDSRIEERRQTFAQGAWRIAKRVMSWIPTIVTIIVGLIVIRAWLSGELSGTEAALSMPL